MGRGLIETVASSSIDGFPFVGAIPDRQGHFVAAGYTGHGKIRSLHIVSTVPSCSSVERKLTYA